MKKTFRLSIIVLSLFITLGATWGLFKTSEQMPSNFNTKSYNIKINTGGGNIASTTITIRNGKTELPTPVKTGYKFLGYGSSSTSGVDFNTTIEDISTINDKDIYAKWSAIDYEISYNLGGGSISGEKDKYNVEENYTLPTPTKTGYTFTGWTGSNGTVPNKNVTIAKGSTGNKSYTANWTTTSYTITYNLNGGTNNSSNPSSYTVESNTISLETPTRTGYTFTGWTGSNGTTKQTSVKIAKGSTGNKSYTANWNVIDYEISYNLGGGSISGEKDKYNVEGNYTLPTPTKTGYTFTGWTGSNGTVPNKNVTIAKGSTGNKSYTANWTINSYTITYNLNGGTNNSSNPSSYTVENNAISLGTPTRTGYTFTGWTGSNGTTKQTSVTIAKGSTGNKTFDANWSVVDYDISYNLNGGSISEAKNKYTVEENFTLQTPAKTGYTFAGWTGDNGTTKQTSVTIAKGSTGNKSYTANWTATSYTITYNLNGGTATNPSNYTIETNTFKLNNPTRTGYKFTGWTGSNGTTANTNVSIAKGSTGNKTFAANWSKINATSTGVTIYAYRSEDTGSTYNQWSKGPWGKYYTNSVSISDVGTWDLVVANNYVELKGTTVVVSSNRCYKLEVYAGNNGRNGEFLGSDIECTVNENHNTTSKAYLKVNW